MERRKNVESRMTAEEKNLIEEILEKRKNGEKKNCRREKMERRKLQKRKNREEKTAEEKEWRE